MRVFDGVSGLRQTEAAKNAVFDALGRGMFLARLANAAALSSLEARSNAKAMEKLFDTPELATVESIDFDDFRKRRQEEIFVAKEQALIQHTVVHNLGSEAFIEELRPIIED